MWNRVDGEMNPFKSKNIVLKDESSWNVQEGILDYYKTYFDEDIYSIYMHSMLDMSLSYYVDVALIDGSYELMFFLDGMEPYTLMSKGESLGSMD